MFQGFVGREGNLCVVRGMNQEEIKHLTTAKFDTHNKLRPLFEQRAFSKTLNETRLDYSCNSRQFNAAS